MPLGFWFGIKQSPCGGIGRSDDFIVKSRTAPMGSEFQSPCGGIGALDLKRNTRCASIWLVFQSPCGGIGRSDLMTVIPVAS